MARLNHQELAWAAGFYDGEGCTTIHGEGRGWPAPRISIGQVDRFVLDRFQSAVMGLGVVCGPNAGVPSKNQRPSYKYYTYRHEFTQAVIALLWKWLSPMKRQQAIKVLTVYRQHITERPCLKRGMTICKHGHDCSAVDSIYIDPRTRKRRCVECRRTSQAAWNEKNRLAANAYRKAWMLRYRIRRGLPTGGQLRLF
jgi:hypothetical protein